MAEKWYLSKLESDKGEFKKGEIVWRGTVSGLYKKATELLYPEAFMVKTAVPFYPAFTAASA